MTSPASLTLKWYFENKLIAADLDNESINDIFYKFDALGRRVGRDDANANFVSFQDGQQTIADYPSVTTASSPTYTYVYTSYIDEPVMRGGSGGLRYYHRNQQYSITAVSDGGGSVVERYAYSAYGQVTIADASGSVISNSAISNRYTYTGREWDEGLSLYHYRARMYDAVAGRFVSRDPNGFAGSEWNLFEYIGGTPLHTMDPTGQVNHHECASLSRRIGNVSDRIKRRNEDLIINHGNLPETHPNDDTNPALSRRGHRNLISKDKALLARLLAEYAVKCGGDAACQKMPRRGIIMRCVGPICWLYQGYEIIKKPKEYWEKETRPFYQSPPFIFTPLGPTINHESGVSPWNPHHTL